MQLVTRAALGWPVSAAPMQATTKGTKVHYEGTEVSTALLTDHGACIAQWKAIRESHLANKKENYSDIAYNYGACPHGYLLEGRGLGRRTGANGNQPLNIAHYSICGLVGSEGLTEPTPAMLSAIRDGIDLLREHGAGAEIKGHCDGYATDCPGAPLYAWVQKGAPRPTTDQEDDTMPLTKGDIETLLSTRMDDPTRPGTATVTVRGALWAAYGQANQAAATTARVQAQVGALTGLVTQVLATAQKGGGLTVEQAKAAAKAGAEAALAQLGDALTKEN